MYSWVRFSQMTDQSGRPRQFFNAEGEVFIIGYKRVSGPSDAVLPRRVVGMGATRDLATANGMEAMRAYDASPTIVPSS